MLTFLQFVFLIAAMLSVCWLAAHGSPFYRTLLDEQNKGRYVALDGLRGYLASSVFVSHAITYYFHFQDGGWQWPPSKLFTFAGQVPVILFFMITGFLFWGKMLAGKISWPNYYRGRFLRVMPLYFFLILVVLLILGVETRWSLQVPIPRVLAEVLLLVLPFRGWPNVNGINAGTMMAMVWTLRYEVAFYALLPAFAVFKNTSRFIMLCLIAVCLYAINLEYDFWPSVFAPTYWIIFFFGMAVAQIIQSMGIKNFSMLWKPHALSIIAGASLGSLAFFPSDAYNFFAYTVIAIAFFCFALGANFFGLLTMAPARLLGSISYSIYLLHLVLLHVILCSIHHFTPIVTLTNFEYFLIVLGNAVVLTFTSLITYRYIEHPFLRGLPRNASGEHFVNPLDLPKLSPQEATVSPSICHSKVRP